MAVVSVEAQRRVACPECGDVRWVAARNARDVVRGERPGLCTHCRFPPRPGSAEEHDALCRWWLDRYADEEIAELAGSFGVDDASTKRVAARRASLSVHLVPEQPRSLEPLALASRSPAAALTA